MSQYAFISASKLIKNSQAKLKGIMVSAASSTPTITVYDQETAGTSVTVIDTFTPTAATNYNFFDGINCTNGLYVVISGTVKATVYYE
jgi:hypothetical protein